MKAVYYLLVFLFLNLVLLYWFQQQVMKPDSNTASNLTTTTQPIIISPNDLPLQPGITKPLSGNTNKVEDLDLAEQSKNKFMNANKSSSECQSRSFVNNKCRLAGNQGPVLGFHQSFKPSVGQELGWRSYFIRKFGGLGTSQNPDNGIMGTLTQNYLDTLPSTDNVYRQTDY